MQSSEQAISLTTVKKYKSLAPVEKRARGFL